MRSGTVSTARRVILHAVVVAILILPIGTAIHEAGHAAAASAFGMSITDFNVLGVRLYPSFGWARESGYFGYVSWSGTLEGAQRHLVAMAGSAATLLVSIVALLTLRRRRRNSWSLGRTMHLTLVAWFGDLLVHTLPILGVPQYLFFGSSRSSRDVSEFYYAAIDLGIPRVIVLGALFTYAAAAVSRALTISLLRRRESDVMTTS